LHEVLNLLFLRVACTQAATAAAASSTTMTMEIPTPMPAPVTNEHLPIEAVATSFSLLAAQILIPQTKVKHNIYLSSAILYFFKLSSRYTRNVTANFAPCNGLLSLF
jgi:hypothetical protein